MIMFFRDGIRLFDFKSIIIPIVYLETHKVVSSVLLMMLVILSSFTN